VAFSPVAAPFKVGTQPRSVAVADFNGDGKMDWAAADADSNDIAIWLADGKGGFNAAKGSPFAAGKQPRSVVAADFNGDGAADLVGGSYNSENFTVLLGDKSSGTLVSAKDKLTLSNYSASLATGDFNGDKKIDLLSTNVYEGQTGTAYLGDGKGGFAMAPGSPFNLGQASSPIALGDVNGDGKLDIAMASVQYNTAKVWLGNGGGGFAVLETSTVAVGKGPQAVALADFDGDNKLDLVTTNADDNSLSVAQGLGTGLFNPAKTVAAGTNPWGVATGDLNADGRADLVIANSGDNTVSALLNTCK
jgi:hypothetical protein